MPSVRIWDLPTRLFHWVLALAVVLLVISAKVGGDAMHLHMRLGYLVFALLLFRLVWGVLGGHWSRFARFVPTPARLRAYLRGSPEASLHAGHNPLGALSVLAMLAVLSLQVASGLFADDEIAYSGPLTARASFHFHINRSIISMSPIPQGERHGKNSPRCRQSGVGPSNAGRRTDR